MTQLQDALERSPLLQMSPLGIAITLVVYLAFLAIAISVIVDFSRYHRQNRGVKRSARSWVETGSMTAFFVLYYLAIRFHVLDVPTSGALAFGLVTLGLGLVVLGTVFNVVGRFYLKSNWANQIKIYDGHFLVTTGPYRVVRHPLYASLIWMMVGGAFVYGNLAGLLLTLGVFVPMMYVRAKKEDALLAEAFGEQHAAYRRRTGMLFPRPPRG